MNIRKIAFLLIDQIRGGQVTKDLHDIQYRIQHHLGNPGALAQILKYATTYVKAYQHLHGASGLHEFPVVNKDTFRKNIFGHLSSQFNPNLLAKATTSGSTGTPFTIYFDKRKIQRHQAALIFWNEYANAPIGQRLFYMRVWNNLNKKPRLRQFIENIIPVDVAHFSVQDCQTFLSQIIRYKKDVAILGFANALSTLNRLACGMDCPNNIKSMIAMSEHLPESVRMNLQKMFGCDVFARYSNMENGFIAQQYDDSGQYLINTADFIVEILQFDNDSPAHEGEMGRIIVTDLYNHAMPFIRYDTGDIGTMTHLEDGSQVLSAIEGRKSDVILDTCGRPVSSHAISISMWSFTEISQYQFVQKSEKDYLYRLNINGKSFNRETELIDLARKYLGEDANISFEYVSEIPILNSGKRRYIINEYSSHQ